MKLCFCALTLLVATSFGQWQGDASFLNGFTSFSGEHEIIILEAPMVVRAARGTITFRGESPMANVFIEIRDKHKKMRSVETKENGKFKLQLEEGDYDFKVSAIGFKSIAGRLQVRNSAPKTALMNFQMTVAN